jgi:hypothetical protein
MPIIQETVVPMLCEVLKSVPLGTNIGLFYLIYALISGQFLQSRGGLFPALGQMGLTKSVVCRCWQAFAKGGWEIGKLIHAWRMQVERDGRWQAVRVEGYRVKAVDLTAVYRPHMKQCRSKHYHPLAEKAIPAIEIGLSVDVGKVDEQIVPLADLMVSHVVNETSDTPLTSAQLQKRLVQSVSQTQESDAVYLFDAGFSLAQLIAAGLKCVVVRMAKNGTARGSFLPPPQAHGRPAEYGEVVRPFARCYRDHALPATPCDESFSYQQDERTITVQLWHHLVEAEQKVSADAPTFSIAAILDPRYKQPWLLAATLPLSPEAWPIIYRLRWTVERPPLIAKTLLGTQRQFVHSLETGFRLFSLALLSACILAYFAALFPPLPSGFGDRNPTPTAGRFRRFLAACPFPTLDLLPEKFRKKLSVFDYLPMGIFAHRRVNSSPSSSLPLQTPPDSILIDASLDSPYAVLTLSLPPNLSLSESS